MLSSTSLNKCNTFIKAALTFLSADSIISAFFSISIFSPDCIFLILFYCFWPRILLYSFKLCWALFWNAGKLPGTHLILFSTYFKLDENGSRLAFSLGQPLPATEAHILSSLCDVQALGSLPGPGECWSCLSTPRCAFSGLLSHTHTCQHAVRIQGIPFHLLEFLLSEQLPLLTNYYFISQITALLAFMNSVS